MNAELIDYKEAMRDVKRALDDERERLTEKIDRLNGMMKMADITDELISEHESLKEELEEERTENERLRQLLKEKEIQIAELSKLTAGVAKKSSQDDLQKALNTYINISKRKTLSKRITVKMIIMELCNAVGFVMSEEMAETLESLDDDEPTEPKLTIQAKGDVKVEGDYNDIHDNKAVRVESRGF